jgi:hypothetical protein
MGDSIGVISGLSNIVVLSAFEVLHPSIVVDAFDKVIKPTKVSSYFKTILISIKLY